MNLLAMKMIITGDPIDGFRYFGPFADGNSACDWADSNVSEMNWWIAELNVPTAPADDDTD